MSSWTVLVLQNSWIWNLLHNHLYIFQEASTEVGFHMAFTKVCGVSYPLIPPYTPFSTLCPTHAIIVSLSSLHPFHTTWALCPFLARPLTSWPLSFPVITPVYIQVPECKREVWHLSFCPSGSELFHSEWSFVSISMHLKFSLLFTAEYV